jgi:hypothetical protein
VTGPVKLLLGNTVIESGVSWAIADSRFQIQGAGPQFTAIEYVGAETVAAVVALGEPEPTAAGAGFVGYRL